MSILNELEDKMISESKKDDLIKQLKSLKLSDEELKQALELVDQELTESLVKKIGPKITKAVGILSVLVSMMGVDSVADIPVDEFEERGISIEQVIDDIRQDDESKEDEGQARFALGHESDK